MSRKPKFTKEEKPRSVIYNIDRVDEYSVKNVIEGVAIDAYKNYFEEADLAPYAGGSTKTKKVTLKTDSRQDRDFVNSLIKNMILDIEESEKPKDGKIYQLMNWGEQYVLEQSADINKAGGLLPFMGLFYLKNKYQFQRHGRKVALGKIKVK